MIDWKRKYLEKAGYWINEDNDYVRVHTNIYDGGLSFITFKKEDKEINLKKVDSIDIYILKSIIDEILGER